MCIELLQKALYWAEYFCLDFLIYLFSIYLDAYIIGFLFFLIVPYLQKVFKNLKDSLKKCLDKRRALSKSGAAASALPICKYFEAMRFLHDKTSNLETHSNVDLEIQPVSNNSFDLSSSLQYQDPIPSPSSCSSISDDAKCPKRKRATIEHNDPFLEQVKSMDEKMINYLAKTKDKEENNEKDEAELFCSSLIPVLRDMNKKQLRLAKLKVQQLLYDLQYEQS